MQVPMTTETPDNAPERPQIEVVEVEAEALGPEEEPHYAEPEVIAKRFAGRLLTVLSAFAIDVVDFGTRMPFVGLPIGAAAGWWLSGRLHFPTRQRIWVTVGAGLYCMFPPTSWIPIATALVLISSIFPGSQQRPEEAAL